MTPNNETFHVVSLVGQGSVFQSTWMGFGIKSLVNGLKTDKSTLSSLHHREPDDEEPKEEEGNHRRNATVCGTSRLLREDGSHDHGNREDQEATRVQVLERLNTCPNYRTRSLLFLLHGFQRLALSFVRVMHRVTVFIRNWQRMIHVIIPDRGFFVIIRDMSAERVHIPVNVIGMNFDRSVVHNGCSSVGSVEGKFNFVTHLCIQFSAKGTSRKRKIEFII